MENHITTILHIYKHVVGTVYIKTGTSGSMFSLHLIQNLNYFDISDISL